MSMSNDKNDETVYPDYSFNHGSPSERDAEFVTPCDDANNPNNDSDVNNNLNNDNDNNYDNVWEWNESYEGSTYNNWVAYPDNLIRLILAHPFFCILTFMQLVLY